MSYELHSRFHPEWYETIERYHPSDTFLHILREIIPATWRLARRGIWFSLHPPNVYLPEQGWKIHVSATSTHCEEILRHVAAFCQEQEIAFKCLLDPYCLRLSTSTLWSRAASGKFITIYPLDELHFREILEALYARLHHYPGPYILSDKRYKDAEVLFYRYGGIASLNMTTLSGDHTYLLRSPQGELIPDHRLPYWSPPAWVSDPFATHADEECGQEEEDSTLKEGRYHIQDALQLSVDGGVYLATDTHSGNSVIIKEARPHVNVDANGSSATDRLQKEYAQLQKLQDSGLTPAPIDLFWDWEHLFLVEEYLPGLTLNTFIVGNHPLIKTGYGRQDIEAYMEKLKPIWTHLAEGIALLHAQGLVYGDLSLRNIIISDVGLGTLHLIDLETAWEEGRDLPTGMATAGFIHPAGAAEPGKRQDIYAFGALLLATLFPITEFLGKEPAARARYMAAVCRDLCLPPEVPQLIERCMSNDESGQPTLQQAIEVIQQIELQEAQEEPQRVPIKELQDVVEATLHYIHASADLSRDDRLFPADPQVFTTNSLNVAYGAAGVVSALALIEGEVPTRIRAWLLSRSFQPDHLPPGLYLGGAGLAWVLWEMGLYTPATRILTMAWDHPLLWEGADLLSGAAGVGLACLRIYLAVGDQLWLERAREVGEWLLQNQTTSAEGASWPDKEGATHLGYARGASGIALYLYYLSLLAEEERFLAAGRQALAFDIAHLRTVDESGHLSVPRAFADPTDRVVYPYWFSGSAGIATVLLRFWTHTGEASYLDVLERLAPTVAHKYAVFPGLFQGLSGLGNFLLDAYQFTGDERYLQQAHTTAQGLLLSKLERPQGVAFPGDGLLRISTDFATGGAGIALFLHRLAHADQQHNFNFTLDHLLPKGMQHVPSSPTCAASEIRA